MKIVIFGASGKTGALLTEQALAKGHIVAAFVRKEGAILQQHTNLRIVTGNLNDTEKLREAISGSDAVMSTLGGGSLTKHSSEIIAGIDRVVSIMEQEKVDRFIYLSSLGAGNSRNLMSPVIRFFISDIMLRVPLADHTANEQRLAKSKLKWTVVRPGGLTDGPKTGKLHHGSDTYILKGSHKISRANVASFMLNQLNETAYINKAAWLYEQG